jgi:hypothetical protein
MQLEIVGCRLKIANFRLQISDLSIVSCLPERPNGLGRAGQSCLILKTKILSHLRLLRSLSCQKIHAERQGFPA